MEEKKKHAYKIEIGDTIRVFRKDYNDKIFYNVQMTQTNYDKTKKKYYRPINFKKGIVLPNETDIIILDMFENLRDNKADKYNPITALFISEFKIVEDEEKLKAQAYNEYEKNIKGIDDEQINENTICSDDLPF